MTFCLFLTAGASANEVAERREYEAIIAGATAELKLYEGWYTALLGRATLLTPEVRAAQDARVAYLSGGAAPTTPAAGAIEVVLSAASHWKDTLQVAGDGTAPWTVSLRAGERDCTGSPAVTQLKKPTEMDRTLYPHITDFDRVFRLSWPAEACGGAAPTGMQMHGRHGLGVFAWRR
jgi:hypothetical protein